MPCGYTPKQSMKGQLTISNLILWLFALFLFFAMLPTMIVLESQAIAAVTGTPTDFTGFEVILIYGLNFFILLALIVTLFHWAQPQTPYGYR